LSYLYSGGSFSTITNVPGVVSPNFTLANAINDAGQIVGYYQLGPNCGVCGFVLTNGAYTTLGNGIEPLGINNLGQIVGVIGGNNGFLFSNGTYTTIAVPGATWTEASAINNLGQIVGSYQDSSGTHGFLLSNGIFTTIDGPMGTYIALLGINDFDQIVGQYQYTPYTPPSPTPLPATLPLFATGLGALGLLGWRRKRKCHEIIVAPERTVAFSANCQERA
jgi:probable HAF family extracellular repeat protein